MKNKPVKQTQHFILLLPSMEDLTKLIYLAETTALIAGDKLSSKAENSLKVKFESPYDVKIQADIETEKIICQKLTKASSYYILGEEEGGDASLVEKKERYWVIDPLDGTYNYVRNIPICGVSIALLSGETPLLGVIYDFNQNELFSAIATETLLLNGKPINVSDGSSRESLILVTGFSSKHNDSKEALQSFIERVEQFKKIRMIGSAAMALAYVAAGRADVYFEESMYLWDIAGGIALVKAVGGVIKMKRCPEKPLTYDVWAARRPEFIDNIKL